MLVWLDSHATLAEAVATVLLALFAAVQVGLEMHRHRDRRRAAAIRVKGPAWLARRNLEAALDAAVDQRSAYQWAELVGSKRSLDIMERHMLTTLRLASTVGGSVAADGSRAFDEFLGFANKVNALCILPTSDPRPTTDERRRANSTAREALIHLRNARELLENIIPRQDHESPLPPDSRVPLLSGSPDPYSEEGPKKG